jgi:hypothetical protein
MISKPLLIVTLVLLFLHQSFITVGQDCKKLQDGQYKVKFKSRYEKPDYTLLVTGDSIQILNKNEKVTKGRIEWLSGCYFKFHLEDDTQKNGKIDSLNNIQSALLTLGEPCYEFLNEKNEFRETYCGNLHITISEGQIIKLKK